MNFREDKSPKDVGGNKTSASTVQASASEEKKNEVKVTKRRAISAVYDQLNEQDFWCPRCGCKMEEPRLLPCLHSVCSNCVNDFMSKSYHGTLMLTTRRLSLTNLSI